jgi:hypothetical protein
MSWSGTVTCSHCYRQGHNKRKCPVLSEQIKEQYEGSVAMVKQHRADGSENDAKWYEQRAEEKRQLYIKRTKIDLATGKKVTNKVAKAERMKKVTCGYCGERGHTRRVCPHVKRDKQVFIEETRRVRIAAFETAANLGIGIGSMIPIRSSGYDADGNYRSDILTLRYIKSVDWDACVSGRQNLAAYHIDARKLAAPDQHRWTSRDRLERLVENHQKARAYAAAEGDNLPASSLLPGLDPPKGWFEPTAESLEYAIQREFPTQGRKYDKQRNYDYAYPSGTTAEVIKDLGLQEHYPDGRWA